MRICVWIFYIRVWCLYFIWKYLSYTVLGMQLLVPMFFSILLCPSSPRSRFPNTSVLGWSFSTWTQLCSPNPNNSFAVNSRGTFYQLDKILRDSKWDWCLKNMMWYVRWRSNTEMYWNLIWKVIRFIFPARKGVLNMQAKFGTLKIASEIIRAV